MSNMKVTRRQFLAGSGTVAGGLVLGIGFSSNTVASLTDGAHIVQPNAWLQITPENQVIFQLDKTEMGQGVMTALPTILAEELGIDPRDMVIEFAHVHSDFQDPVQITGGSTSVAARWDILRETGAKARSMLITAAAASWGIAESQCDTEGGRVVRKDTLESKSFGDVAAAAAELPVPEEVALKNESDFKYLGKSLRRFDAEDKSTGKTVFGIDVQLEGLVNAVVMRNPHFNKNLGHFDTDRAKRAPGVIDIIVISSGIAVIADTYWHARSASKLINVEWEFGPLFGVTTESIREDWRRAAGEEGKSVRSDGAGAEGFKTAANVLDAIYEVPYLAHATMEPQNSTARFVDGVCEIWSPTQGPDVTQALVAEVLKMPRKRVIVHTTFMGGGFGRRGIPDFAVDAAEIARAIDMPVKVTWSREDDMQHDYYRPATYNVMKAGLDEHGVVRTWQHKLVAPSMTRSILPIFASLAPEWIPDWAVNALVSGASGLVKTRDPSTTEGAVELPYKIENIDISHVFHDPGIPLGFWRSVGHSQNAFITESFIDELAYLAGEDPFLFRRQLLRESPDHIAVLDLAAGNADWGRKPEGIFQGIAIHKSFGTIVAEVVDISLEDGQARILKVTCAIDCGFAVNPDQVKAQVESAVVFGMTAALKGKITVKNGAVEQSNFHDYPMLRMDETPEISVHILPSSKKPTGVGEPGTPPIAPAVANALFAATRVRQRVLPLSLAWEAPASALPESGMPASDMPESDAPVLEEVVTPPAAT